MTDLFVRFYNRPGSDTWSKLALGTDINVKQRKVKRPTPPPKATAPQEGPDQQLFKLAIDEYVTALSIVGTSFGPVIQAIPSYADQKFHQESCELMNKFGELVKKNKDGATYRLDIKHASKVVDNLIEKVQFISYIMFAPKFFLIGLVSLYDDYLSKIIHDYFTAQPGSLSSSEKQMSFKEILSINDLQSLKEHIVEKEVETIIRESHIAHFEWIEKRLGIPLRKNLEIWPKFVEICERRNLLTHSNGRVNNQYLSVCRNNSVDVKNIKVGDVLSVSLPYFKSSLDVFLEIGIKLGHVVWRKSIPENTEISDSNLSRICYDLIKQKRYGIAINVLDFAVSMPNIATDAIRRMFIVNRANAYKLSGNKSKSLEILATEDWTATDPAFRVSVAAVRDDIKEAIKLMGVIGNSGDVDAESYREWPVFETLRKEKAFSEKFTEVFGFPFLPDGEPI